MRVDAALRAAPRVQAHAPNAVLRVDAALDVALRAAGRIQCRDGHEQRLDQRHIGRPRVFLDLPPADTGAKQQMLLSAQGDDGHVGPLLQQRPQLALLPFVQRRPHPVMDNVRVVAHPLRLVAPRDALQRAARIIGAKQTRVADDVAVSELVVVHERRLHPAPKRRADVLHAAECARAGCIAWHRRCAGSVIHDVRGALRYQGEGGLAHVRPQKGTISLTPLTYPRESSTTMSTCSMDERLAPRRSGATWRLS